MRQILKNGRLWVDYNTIWSDLETIFSLEAPEIQEIITKWMDETYKLEGVKSHKSIFPSFNRWKGLNILTI